MKKMTVLLLAVLMTLQFAGCVENGGSTADQNPEVSVTPNTTPNATPELTEGGKIILTIGAFSGNSAKGQLSTHKYGPWGWLNKAVGNFNISNKEFELRIVDYGDSGTPEALYRLNTEIIARQVPDMLMTLDMPVERYGELGLLYDMSDWLDPSEFFTGPLEAMKTSDGKLYRVSPAITVTTFYGKSEYIGEDGNISISGLMEAWERFNDSSKMFLPFMNAEQICQLLILATESQFVDLSAGTCNFDSPEFVKLLELCKNLPDEKFLVDKYNNSAYKNAGEMIFPVSVECGDSLLGILTTSTLSSYTAVSHANVNDIFKYIPLTYIGIPGTGQAGFSIDFPIAVSAGTRYPEVAREFLDTLWDVQFAAVHGGENRRVPLKRAVLEEWAQSRTTWSYHVELGYEPEDEVVFTIPDSKNDEPYTLKDFAVFLDFVDSAALIFNMDSAMFIFNNDLQDIIREEIQAFFAGTQDAKRTAELIQSRYSIFLAEQN